MSPAGEFAMFLAFGAAAAGVLFGPIGAALGRRFGGRPDPDTLRPEMDQLSERVTGEVDELRARLAEVEERLDFAERVLARGVQADQILGGSQQ